MLKTPWDVIAERRKRGEEIGIALLLNSTANGDDGERITLCIVALRDRWKTREVETMIDKVHVVGRAAERA